MSRIGNKVIPLPKDVTFTANGTTITVKGPLGSLTKTFSPLIKVEIENNEIACSRANDLKATKQLHGTTRALLANMIEGVTKGFKRQLEIKGIGFKGEVTNNVLTLRVGYSHDVIVKPLPGVKIVATTPTEIAVTGMDKQDVGQIASLIRGVRPPEPYLGKGIIYKGEIIRRKEGKKAGK